MIYFRICIILSSFSFLCAFVGNMSLKYRAKLLPPCSNHAQQCSETGFDEAPCIALACKFTVKSSACSAAEPRKFLSLFSREKRDRARDPVPSHMDGL